MFIFGQLLVSEPDLPVRLVPKGMFMLSSFFPISQVVFASIFGAQVVRTVWLFNYSPEGSQIPPSVSRPVVGLFVSGAGLFAFGFFIWNLDNIFCDIITDWKVQLGWPAAFLLEGEGDFLSP